MLKRLEKKEKNRSLYYLVNESIIYGSNPKMSGDFTGLRGDCSDLIGRCSALVGDCSALRGDITGLKGDCSKLWGDCSDLIGNCTLLWGDCTGISGDLDLCEITDDERNYGVKVEDLVFKSEEEK